MVSFRHCFNVMLVSIEEKASRESRAAHQVMATVYLTDKEIMLAFDAPEDLVISNLIELPTQGQALRLIGARAPTWL